MVNWNRNKMALRQHRIDGERKKQGKPLQKYGNASSKRHNEDSIDDDEAVKYCVM